MVAKIIGMMSSTNLNNKDPSQQRLDSLAKIPQQQPGTTMAVTGWLIITGFWVVSIVVLTGIAHMGAEWMIS
ncbi:MAG: hypothetical protein AB7U63_15935 [Porticoccaceae bacterium]